jgi:hypothetical protein
MGVALVACVVCVCVTVVACLRMVLSSRERREAMKAREVDEGLRLLPAQVADIERRLRQLEVRGVMGR